MKRRAIIIGAGPAGLTAAYELLTRTDIQPIVLEKSTYMGGICRTVNYKGNRMDIGGHRFFSKSDRVMNWWFQHLPIADAHGEAPTISYRGSTHIVPLAAAMRPQNDSHTSDLSVAVLESSVDERDRVMLVRPRKSRIYFLHKLFDYPIQLSTDTLAKLGLRRSFRIALSYVRTALFPIRNATNLEQFFINRFGAELYQTFFKSYTEKVWGTACNKIAASWGEQRIKGLSIRKAILHQLRKMSPLNRQDAVRQKHTETSLIERFLYPKFGPGQMWETVADKIRQLGGEIITEFEVEGIDIEDFSVTAVRGTDRNGQEKRFAGDYFFSTMPIQELIRAFRTNVPMQICEITEGLIYRDFIAVGLLCKRLKLSDPSSKLGKLVTDNWIYIQEPDVLVGRLQIFNNWSPHLVRDPEKVWLGAEYFCYKTDELWSRSDAEIARFAAEELQKIKILDREDVIDSTVVRMPKTYPAYFGTYDRLQEVRDYLERFHNLFLIGRNGMHKYNNQDHSMLTAMTAIDNIIAQQLDKSNIWSVNTETDYHESK